MFKTNITERLGIKHPIIAAPMGPFYTTELTVAVSEAGGLGVLSHTNLEGKSSYEEMIKNLDYVVEHTDKPFGLNIRTSRLQVDAPLLVNRIPRYILKNQKLRDQCVYIVTSAGSPKMLPKSRNYVKLKKAVGEKLNLFHVTPALRFMKKAIDAGCDGLVVTGTEGGGHQSYEQVTTLVLLQEAQKHYPDIPKIACGGYATGAGLASALSLGAGAVAMGSRFIASNESEFHQAYKDVVPPAESTETLLTTGVFGPIRLWVNDFSKNRPLVGDKEEKLKEEKMSVDYFKKEQEQYELTYKGDVQNGAVLLGQSIGLMDTIKSLKDIFTEILEDAKKSLQHAHSMIQ